jgi:ADP-ribose pyrophosphatase
VRTDTVRIHDSTVDRDVLIHPGAVVVIAVDDQDRVLLIRQYRHPIAMLVFEPPAGLLDVEGEPPAVTAARELAEEAGFQAETWYSLVDFYNSPGGSSEAIRVYLARGLTEIPGGRPQTGEAEEAFLPRAWVPLDEAVDLVLSGRLGSPSAVVGILAAKAARDDGWRSLRPMGAPWPARAHLLAEGRVHGGH